jgi:hypothetical protein
MQPAAIPNAVGISAMQGPAVYRLGSPPPILPRGTTPASL